MLDIWDRSPWLWSTPICTKNETCVSASTSASQHPRLWWNSGNRLNTFHQPLRSFTQWLFLHLGVWPPLSTSSNSRPPSTQDSTKAGRLPQTEAPKWSQSSRTLPTRCKWSTEWVLAGFIRPLPRLLLRRPLSRTRGIWWNCWKSSDRGFLEQGFPWGLIRGSFCTCFSYLLWAPSLKLKFNFGDYTSFYSHSSIVDSHLLWSFLQQNGSSPGTV